MSDSTNTENNKLVRLDTSNTEDVVGETAQLLSAVGDLSRDTYIGAVRQARSFVQFLHKQVKSPKTEN